MSAIEDNTFHALVTGVNSGLGFAICCRLIDEFLHTRPESQSLNLIITTRDRRKSDDTIRRLRKHLQSTLRRADASRKGISKLLEPRISFQQELVDLTSLRSVQKLARELLASTPKLDAVILNAGLGGFVGINWPAAVYELMTDLLTCVTYPTFKIGSVGRRTKPQLVSDNSDVFAEQEPPLGEVFCANLFGHYLLTHDLMPLLSQSPNGRIIWVSSLEAYAHSFSQDDFQGLTKPIAYEGSKRLTDILALTSTLPATAPWVSEYLTPPPRGASDAAAASLPSSHRPRVYVSHPGICATSIMPINAIASFFMYLAFYLARFLGSIWQCISPYTGACAPVWLALSPQSLLDSLEKSEGPGKWGSATDWRGNERVERTEVEGWGIGGVVGDVNRGGKRKGRKKGAQDLTKEGREEFEELGRNCWREMERLRMEWERILGGS